MYASREPIPSPSNVSTRTMNYSGNLGMELLTVENKDNEENFESRVYGQGKANEYTGQKCQKKGPM